MRENIKLMEWMELTLTHALSLTELIQRSLVS